MPRKNSRVTQGEIVVRRAPEQIADEFKSMIAQLVEERVKKAMSSDTDAIFQPFFQPREITNGIRDRQTVAEKKKWVDCFEDYGCLRCDTKERPHKSLGLCSLCYSKVVYRLEASRRRRAPDPSKPQETFKDTIELARAALAPSIVKLSNALPGGQQSERSAYKNQGEAAIEAGIHPYTLIRWIKEGKVQHPATKFSPTKWLWTQEDIAALKAVALQTKSRKKGSAS